MTAIASMPACLSRPARLPPAPQRVPARRRAGLQLARTLVATAGAASGWRAMAAAPAIESMAILAMPLQKVSTRCGFVQGLSEMGSSANGNFISNAGFIETADSLVVIDALGSPPLGQRLLEQLRAERGKPVSHVIVTHYHADHIYGLQVFKDAGAEVIAHRKGQDYLNGEVSRLRLAQSRVDFWPWVDEQTRLIAADRWIDAVTDLKVGGVALRIEPVGPAHTAEDLVVHVPDEGVLFCGDLVFAGRIPWVGQADSEHWISALDALLGFDAAVLVPGHGPQSREPRRHIEQTRDYLSALRQAMGEAARNLEPFDEAYQKADWSRFSQLPLFDAANRMNAYNTFLLMEQER